MAKKITDPQFELGYVLPEGVVNDFNLFYKPQTAPQNPAVQNLITSLSNIVPTLANYDVLEKFEDKKLNESKAVEDYNLNKNAFASLVKNKKIPAGANPHYFNKMMELDLANKAKDFQKKFDNYYLDNDLVNQLNPDALKDAYEAELKDYYSKNNLDAYDPLALNKAFFSSTSKYRDNLEKTHNTKRYENIENNTKELAIKNYAGNFIDFQYKQSSIEDVHNFIKSETSDYISLTNNPRMANELLLAGLTNYVGAVNSQEGFDYAGKLIDSLSTLQLGTGDFAGGNRVKFIQKKLKNDLTAKELTFKEKSEKLLKYQKRIELENLEKDYFGFRETSGQQFNIYDLIETVVGEGEFAKDKYSARQKSKLLQIHNGTVSAEKVQTSSPDAVVELFDLKISNPYQIQERALELLNENKLTLSDFQSFSNAAGLYDILNDNVYFRQSRNYNNFKKFFSSADIAQIPSLKAEIPFLINDFETRIVSYYNSIKDLDITPYEIQKRLDAQVLLEVADALSKSVIFRSNSMMRKIAIRYGIYTDNKPNPGAQRGND